MTTKDIIIILAMTLPMFLFTIYPGLKLADFMEEHFHVSEGTKRTVMLGTMFIGAIALSSFMHFA